MQQIFRLPSRGVVSVERHPKHAALSKQALLPYFRSEARDTSTLFGAAPAGHVVSNGCHGRLAVRLVSLRVVISRDAGQRNRKRKWSV